MLIVLVLLSITGNTSSFSDGKKQAYDSAQMLHEVIRKVFEGKEIEKAKSLVKQDGFIVDGAELHLLLEALDGKDKHHILTDERGRHIVTTQFSMTDDQSSAFMIVVTETKSKSDTRAHSIFFNKNDNGGWQIAHWHTGH